MAKAAKAKSDAARRDARAAADDDTIPGPSPNPATNLMIHDVLLRAGGRVLRNGLERALLANRYGSKSAGEMIENRSFLHAAASHGVARLATRSVPGAVIVGGGLLAKTLLDRGRNRRKSRREGDKAMREMAED